MQLPRAGQVESVYSGEKFISNEIGYLTHQSRMYEDFEPWVVSGARLVRLIAAFMRVCCGTVGWILQDFGPISGVTIT